MTDTVLAVDPNDPFRDLPPLDIGRQSGNDPGQKTLDLIDAVLSSGAGSNEASRTSTATTRGLDDKAENEPAP